MEHLLLLLVLVFLLLRAEPGRCRRDASFAFDEPIRHFAVTAEYVYVSTEEKLLQLSRDLTPIRSLSQRGKLEDHGDAQPATFRRDVDASERNVTFSVNVLVPFVENRTLITCGVTRCGYCEIRDLADISKLVHRQDAEVGPLLRRSPSLAFLVKVTQVGTLLLTTIRQSAYESETSACATASKAVNLHNTNDQRSGSLFSTFDPEIRAYGTVKRKGDVEFVDGFQLGSIIYLMANVPAPFNLPKVRLLWLQAERSKVQTVNSLRGATLVLDRQVHGGKSLRLLASSMIHGGSPALWVGVFSVDGSQENTEVVLFDISPNLSGKPDSDTDFHSGHKNDLSSLLSVFIATRPMPKELRPVAVLHKHPFMTSVLAVRQRSWTVLFIGTGDGLLIKLTVDGAYQAGCVNVMYMADDDWPVLPKMHLDTADRKHFYMAFPNQVMRMSVSKCDVHTSLRACRSAWDPYCGWCSSTQRCTFEDECPAAMWWSIPDESTQRELVSHEALREDNGQVTLHVHVHLTRSQPSTLSNFGCHFSTGSGEVCHATDSSPQFLRCTCSLHEDKVSSEGMDVTIEIRFDKETLTKHVKLLDCSEVKGTPSRTLCRKCVAAGCSWSNDGCSWATSGPTADAVCESLPMVTNFSMPEIVSVVPGNVSIYGSNNAVMSGRNLADVTAVRIHTATSCAPQEIAVWNNTGRNLTFHVPGGYKGSASICAVLPDGSCHGNANVVYLSSPSCLSVSPSTTWASGRRRISISGSHLDLVDGLIHSHDPNRLLHPTTSSSEALTYDVPPAAKFHQTMNSAIYLRVANRTLSCSQSFTYLPDPEFLSVTAVKSGEYLHITIKKRPDKLQMTSAEVKIWIFSDGTYYRCAMETVSDDSVSCRVQKAPSDKVQQLVIHYGGMKISLVSSISLLYHILMIPGFIGAMTFVCCFFSYLQKKERKRVRIKAKKFSDGPY